MGCNGILRDTCVMRMKQQRGHWDRLLQRLLRWRTRGCVRAATSLEGIVEIVAYNTCIMKLDEVKRNDRLAR